MAITVTVFVVLMYVAWWLERTVLKDVASSVSMPRRIALWTWRLFVAVFAFVVALLCSAIVGYFAEVRQQKTDLRDSEQQAKSAAANRLQV